MPIYLWISTVMMAVQGLLLWSTRRTLRDIARLQHAPPETETIDYRHAPCPACGQIVQPRSQS